MQGGELGEPRGMTHFVCERLMRRVMKSHERESRAHLLPGGVTCVRGTQVSGYVKCWGSNSYGQLGLGDKIYRGDGPGEMGASSLSLA